MSSVTSDCRDEAGITMGLIDSLISICRVLKGRDMSPDCVKEALKDLHCDEDIDKVFWLASKAYATKDRIVKECSRAAYPESVYTGTGSDYLDCVLGVGGFESFGPIDK